MNNRILEAIAVGILTAIVAGFFGLGARHTANFATSPASSAPLIAQLVQAIR